MASRIEIYVSCPPAEALRRIAAAAPWFELKDCFRLTPLKERCLAKVSGNTFLLRYLWPYWRNSFAPMETALWNLPRKDRESMLVSARTGWSC